MMTETKVAPNDRLTLRGFKVERSDKNNRGEGGGALLIRKHIRYIRLAQMPVRIEHVCIELENGVRNGGCYAPPGLPFAAGDLNPFLLPNQHSLLLEDLNARHQLCNNHRKNARGKSLVIMSTTTGLYNFYTPTPQRTIPKTVQHLYS